MKDEAKRTLRIGGQLYQKGAKWHLVPDSLDEGGPLKPGSIQEALCGRYVRVGSRELAGEPTSFHYCAHCRAKHEETV